MASISTGLRCAQEAAIRKHAEAEKAKLVAAMGWDEAKPEDVKAEQAALREAASTYGFTPDELTATLDSRAFVLLRDAMRYQQMQEKGEAVRKKVKKAPVLKPGSTTGREGSKTKAHREKVKRLERTGSLRDAAAVFEDMLGED